MNYESDVNMRGGGAIGDWYVQRFFSLFSAKEDIGETN